MLNNKDNEACCRQGCMHVFTYRRKMKEKDRAKRRKRKLEGHQAGTSTLVIAKLSSKNFAQICTRST